MKKLFDRVKSVIESQGCLCIHAIDKQNYYIWMHMSSIASVPIISEPSPHVSGADSWLLPPISGVLLTPSDASWASWHLYADSFDFKHCRTGYNCHSQYLGCKKKILCTDRAQFFSYMDKIMRNFLF